VISLILIVIESSLQMLINSLIGNDELLRSQVANLKASLGS
jgi:hypothetical protein